MTLNDLYDERLHLHPNKIQHLTYGQLQELLENSGITCLAEWIDTSYSNGGYGGPVQSGYYSINESNIEKACHDYIVEMGGTVSRTKNGFMINGLSYNEITELIEMVLKMPSAHRFRIDAAIQKHQEIIRKSNEKIKNSTRILELLKMELK